MEQKEEGKERNPLRGSWIIYALEHCRLWSAHPWELQAAKDILALKRQDRSLHSGQILLAMAEQEQGGGRFPQLLL